MIEPASPLLAGYRRTFRNVSWLGYVAGPFLLFGITILMLLPVRSGDVLDDKFVGFLLGCGLPHLNILSPLLARAAAVAFCGAAPAGTVLLVASQRRTWTLFLTATLPFALYCLLFLHPVMAAVSGGDAFNRYLWGVVGGGLVFLYRVVAMTVLYVMRVLDQSSKVALLSLPGADDYRTAPAKVYVLQALDDAPREVELVSVDGRAVEVRGAGQEARCETWIVACDEGRRVLSSWRAVTGGER